MSHLPRRLAIAAITIVGACNLTAPIVHGLFDHNITRHGLSTSLDGTSVYTVEDTYPSYIRRVSTQDGTTQAKTSNMGKNWVSVATHQNGGGVWAMHQPGSVGQAFLFNDNMGVADFRQVFVPPNGHQGSTVCDIEHLGDLRFVTTGVVNWIGRDVGYVYTIDLNTGAGSGYYLPEIHPSLSPRAACPSVSRDGFYGDVVVMADAGITGAPSTLAVVFDGGLDTTHNMSLAAAHVSSTTVDIPGFAAGHQVIDHHAYVNHVVMLVNNPWGQPEAVLMPLPEITGGTFVPEASMQLMGRVKAIGGPSADAGATFHFLMDIAGQRNLSSVSLTQ